MERVDRVADSELSGAPNVAVALAGERPRVSQQLPKAVWMGAMCLALAVGAVTLLRHWFFLSTDYDMAFYAHAISQIAAGEWTNTMFGFHVFADHFSPILILLAPLSFIAPAEGLLIVQALAIGSALIPVFRIGQHVAGTRVGYLGAIWFGLSATVWHSVLYDFRPATLGVVAMIWLIAEMETRGRLPVVIAIAGLAASTREDIAVLTGLAVLIFAVIHRRRSFLPLGAACMGMGIWYGTVGFRLFAPFDHFLWYRYADYGWSPSEVLANLDYAVPTGVVRLLRGHPLIALGALVLPMLVVPIYRGWRYAWPGLLIWVSNALSADPFVPSIYYHYYLPAVVFFLWGAVHGLKQQEHQRRIPLAVAATVGMFLVAGPLGLILPGHDQRTVLDLFGAGERRAYSEVIAAVPGSASVSGGRFILPHLSSNPIVKPYPLPMLCSSTLLSYHPRTEYPDYVVVEDADVDAVDLSLDEIGYQRTVVEHGVEIWRSSGRHPEPTDCPGVAKARAGMFRQVEEAASS